MQAPSKLGVDMDMYLFQDVESKMENKVYI